MVCRPASPSFRAVSIHEAVSGTPRNGPSSFTVMVRMAARSRSRDVTIATARKVVDRDGDLARLSRRSRGQTENQVSVHLSIVALGFTNSLVLGTCRRGAGGACATSAADTAAQERVIISDRGQYVSKSSGACSGVGSLVVCPIRGRGCAPAVDLGRTPPVGRQTRFDPLV